MKSNENPKHCSYRDAIVLPKPKFCLAYQTYQVLKLIF